MKMKLLLLLSITTLSTYSPPSKAGEEPNDSLNAVEEDIEGSGRNDLGHGSCAAHERAIREHEQCIQQARTRTDIQNCGRRPVLPARCG